MEIGIGRWVEFVDSLIFLDCDENMARGIDGCVWGVIFSRNFQTDKSY